MLFPTFTFAVFMLIVMPLSWLTMHNTTRWRRVMLVANRVREPEPWAGLCEILIAESRLTAALVAVYRDFTFGMLHAREQRLHAVIVTLCERVKFVIVAPATVHR